jgi:Fungal Zn(2)-Cys(6) binuclear cluster domain
MQDHPKDQTLFDDLEIPLVKLELNHHEHHLYSRHLEPLHHSQPPIISRSLPPLGSFHSYYAYDYFPYHPVDMFEQGYKSEYDRHSPQDQQYYMPEMPIALASHPHPQPASPRPPLSPLAISPLDEQEYYPNLPPVPAYVPAVEAMPSSYKKGRRKSVQSVGGGYSTDETLQSVDSELKSKRVQVKKACGKDLLSNRLVHCRKSCKKCSEHRPCTRCANMGLDCVDVAKPKKNVKRKGGKCLIPNLDETKIIDWISSNVDVDSPQGTLPLPPLKIDTHQNIDVSRYGSLSAGAEVLRTNFGEREGFEYPTELYPYSYGSR